jgi:hypothetical protein
MAIIYVIFIYAENIANSGTDDNFQLQKRDIDKNSPPANIIHEQLAGTCALVQANRQISRHSAV